VGAFWAAAVLAFVAVTGLWGMTIVGVLAGSHPAADSTAVPTFTGAGDITLSPNSTFVIGPTTGCLFAKGDTGRQVVMSGATGSVLTPAQVRNCTK
jgi:hypothetical protein